MSDPADGIVLWAIHEVNWEDRVDFSKDDLFDEMAVGPDRRLFLTEPLAGGSVEAEVRAEAAGRRADDPDDDPVFDPQWRPLGESGPPAATETSPAGSRWEVDFWGRTYYVLALAVQGRPMEVG